MAGMVGKLALADRVRLRLSLELAREEAARCRVQSRYRFVSSGGDWYSA